MKSTYLKFFEAYEEVSKLCPEDLRSREVINLDYGINRNHFYEKLYVKRNIVEYVKAEILTSFDELLFVVGPRGSGKSTVGRKITDDLEDMNYISIFMSVSRIDAEEKLSEKNRNRLVDWLLSDIKKSLQLILVDVHEDKLLKESLVEYLISNEITEQHRPQHIAKHYIEHRLKFETIRRFSKNEQKNSWKEWLQNNYHNPEVGKLIDDIVINAHANHLYRGIEYSMKKNGMVVWIDNIDALEHDAQIALVDALLVARASIDSNVKFVIAAREENVLRFENQIEPNNAVRKDNIYISEKDFVGDNKKIGFTFPVLGYEYFSAIVMNRLKFARSYQNYLQDSLIKAEKGHDIGISKTVLTARCDRFVPALSEFDYKYVEVIIEKVINSFKLEKIILLNNSDLRSLLKIFSEFLKYLFNNSGIEKGVFDIYYYDQSFMNTVVLFWMARHEGRNSAEQRFFNVVNYVKNEYQRKDKRLGCFLPFITLSTLWNLCLKKKNNFSGGDTFPKVKELVDKIKEIGYEKSDIVECIVDLYHPRNGFTQFIALETLLLVNEEEQLRDNIRVRITYKGKTLISSLCNSFGFLFAMTDLTTNNGMAERKLKPDFLKNYVRETFPALNWIGKVHLNSLLFIRNEQFAGEEDWLDLYYEDFGIPLERDYKRSEKNSKKGYDGVSRILFFDSLLYSFESFLNALHTKGDNIPINLVRELSHVRKFIKEYNSVKLKIEKYEIHNYDEIQLNINFR